ncbi:MAG TPA: insulinase family protein [Paludibacteraceae bacterium]|mgnify:CR=1 FL=1|nr:insulinase family protein [Paludibacteraceae bacterium]HOU67058.1 insulinase family protein [Paludibacteraceae bacterium]HPH62325.1 insulinase family protein [Paludibacteraceae bacterium]HQF49626.1 insulinase family protein [Paludibacteraceae bacterium]
MKKLVVLALGLLSVLGFENVCSQNQNANLYEPIQMDPELRYGILDNGLTYYIRHNDVVPERADFYIVQNVGAILEEDSQNGLAHFLEHIAFNGTKNFPGKGLINYLETVGVKFGANINAYTSLDQTVYNLTSVPTNREGIVDTALMILHDWSGFISMQPDEIDKERGVIREEWRTRANADRRIWSKSLPILFRNSQYAKRDVIGDTAVINNFKPETLHNFYEKWYRPDLQALVIVGDVNVNMVEKELKELFVDIPKRENPTPRPIYQLENNDDPIVAIITDSEARNSRVDVNYRHNPMSDRAKASMPGYVAIITNNLICGMLGQRLQEIAQKADAPFLAAYADYGELVRSKDVFEMMTVPLEGREADALSALLKEGERMRRFGFTQTELDRAKIDLMSSYEKAYNERKKTKNDSYVREYIGNYLDFEPVPGIEWEYMAIQEILPRMTLEEVNNIAKKFIGEKNMTVMISGTDKIKQAFPSEKTVVSLIDEARGSVLEPYKEKAFDKPLVNNKPKKGNIKSEKTNAKLGTTEWTLKNGMRVILKPTQLKEDEILLYAYSEGGLSAIASDDDLPSAIMSTSVVENNGLGEFNLIDLAKMLAGKIVSLSPSVTSYEESLSGSSSVKDFETLMQLFYLNFTAVRADDDAYTALVQKYRTYLNNRVLDPNSAFRDSIQTTLYSHNVRTQPFDLKLLDKLDQKKALDLFRQRFSNPADFTVYIIGNIDFEKIKPAVLTYLGGIPKGKDTEMWVDRNIRKQKGMVKNYFDKQLTVDKSSNFVAYTGLLDFTLENRIAIGMISDILRMRYMESLREQEGGTYGVRTSASVSSKPVQEATLQMTFDTDPKMQEKMISLIHQEVDTFLKNGPRPSDFQKVKENLKNTFNSDQKENHWWLNTMVSYYKDGDDMTTDYMKVVDAMTGEKLRDILKKVVDQKNVMEVVMMPKK